MLGPLYCAHDFLLTYFYRCGEKPPFDTQNFAQADHFLTSVRTPTFLIEWETNEFAFLFPSKKWFSDGVLKNGRGIYICTLSQNATQTMFNPDYLLTILV